MMRRAVSFHADQLCRKKREKRQSSQRKLPREDNLALVNNVVDDEYTLSLTEAKRGCRRQVDWQ
jgi:hypothetical protein